MIWSDAIEAHLHWLPITKIQFEHFLCASVDSQYDAAWYQTLLEKNPRVSPREIRSDNYWNAFLSGLLPAEVSRFCRWLGPDYRIPTDQQWLAAYAELRKKEPVLIEEISQVEGLSLRAKELIENMNSASATATKEMDYERTLADQMLLRLGVMEWIECPDNPNRWGGRGETDVRFSPALVGPEHGNPKFPNNPETQRLSHYGCRLARGVA